LPRPIPVPDEVSKPFWDACNEQRLIIQNCKSCDRMQYPPEKLCASCGSSEDLDWVEVSGKGRINGYAVVYDSRIRLWQTEQPYNIAVVELHEDPTITFFSNLAGVTVDDVPVGSEVQVHFEETENGQKIHEWHLVN